MSIRLSDKDVVSIRKEYDGKYGSVKKLCKKYDVTGSYLMLILKGRARMQAGKQITWRSGPLPFNHTGKKYGMLTVLHRLPKTKDREAHWVCRCECGNETQVMSSNLGKDRTRSCGCLTHKPRFNCIDYTGKTIGRLTILHRIGLRFGRPVWQCRCSCGNLTTVSSTSLSGKRMVRSCGCLQSDVARKSHWNGYGEILGSYFNRIKKGALSRSLRFDITIEQIWDLFLEQSRRCVLTGIPLTFKRNNCRLGIKHEQTASLDRINSKKDYTIDNVQWVHKIVQHMKNKYSQKLFRKVCRLVTKHTEDARCLAKQ